MHAWPLPRGLSRAASPLARAVLAPPAARSFSHDARALPPASVVFSGIQPTGVPHLGNYLGALKPWVDLQDSAPPETKLIFAVADLHAVTVHQDPDALRQWRRETLATLLAVGLRPERCTIYFQSSVAAHTELMWILSCSSSVGQLSRMTQWKSKLSLSDSSSLADGAAKGGLRLGLFSYPVLQAADVLVHAATHVPVGQDQKQHLEFARNCASAFNHTYGPTLVEPEVLLSPAKKIMSLKEPGLKMSKSHADPRSRILLTDTRDEIRAKIKHALTDSQPGVTWDPEHRPGVSNLLEFVSALAPDSPPPSEVAKAFEGVSMRAFKEKVADTVDERLGPIRDSFTSLMQAAQSSKVDRVASEGAAQAQEHSRPILDDVYRKVGLR